MLQLISWGLSAVFLGLICGVIVIKMVTPLNSLLKYGKCYDHKANEKENWILRYALELTVPKYYFQHFYIVFSTCMILVLAFPQQVHFSSAKQNRQSIVAFILMAQAFRRLYETTFIMKANKDSRMNIAHYALGLLFYLLVSLTCYLQLCSPRITSLSSIEIMLVGGYILAAFDQYRSHKHLALLKKYSLPTKGMFNVVACPHYLDEILIYTIVAVLAATCEPTLTDVNYSLAALFVAVNLSVSSRESYRYYQTFKDKYNTKWSIIPCLL